MAKTPKIRKFPTAGIAISETLNPYHLTITNHMFLLFPKLKGITSFHSFTLDEKGDFPDQKPWMFTDHPHLIVFDYNERVTISSLMVLTDSHNFMLAGKDGSMMFYQSYGDFMPQKTANVLFEAGEDNQFVTIPFEDFELIAA